MRVAGSTVIGRDMATSARKQRPSGPVSSGPQKRKRAVRKRAGVAISRESKEAELALSGRTVKLTNLKKVYWPARGITKGDLLRYYAEMAAVVGSALFVNSGCAVTGAQINNVSSASYTVPIAPNSIASAFGD